MLVPSSSYHLNHHRNRSHYHAHRQLESWTRSLWTLYRAYLTSSNRRRIHYLCFYPDKHRKTMQANVQHQGLTTSNIKYPHEKHGLLCITFVFLKLLKYMVLHWRTIKAFMHIFYTTEKMLSMISLLLEHSEFFFSLNRYSELNSVNNINSGQMQMCDCMCSVSHFSITLYVHLLIKCVIQFSTFILQNILFTTGLINKN